ncbi:hypothetical protein GCM10012275_48160 [Longimycelium tulufanense]|uniref:Lanthionine synthetase n=2 Tax=Longimycelium tulufanense TaxID=907463 RepID=A0A8J3CGE9_9PSEU|nr:hypothetical protein GCM10012275_48160 [Longimycelium tulufanense]
MRHRKTAESVALEVADRLRDPAAVVATSVRSPTAPSSNITASAWDPLALGNGHVGISLLFAHLGQRHGRPDPATHHHLSAAVVELERKEHGGGGSLFRGAPAVAFAAAAAAQDPGHYRRLLSTLDDMVAARANQLVRIEEERVNLARAGTSPRGYDAISGLAGLGRYTLGRGDSLLSCTRSILRCLVRLTDPVTVKGRPVPGWWIAEKPPPSHGTPFNQGYFDLGIAHGIAGPLALLALAARHGVSVPGQRDAIERIAQWLLDWQLTDDYGPSWPTTVSLEEECQDQPPPVLRTRGTAWCYGAPGIARALQVAGHVMGRPEWERSAVAATNATLSRERDRAMLHDAGLCHGWSGLLQCVIRIADHADDPLLRSRIPELVDHVVDHFDPATEFGFRAYSPLPQPGWYLDDAGYLEGAAGIALALLTAADLDRPADSRKAMPWDAALLIT